LTTVLASSRSMHWSVVDRVPVTHRVPQISVEPVFNRKPLEATPAPSMPGS
jgi:hypothetical protein